VKHFRTHDLFEIFFRDFTFMFYLVLNHTHIPFFSFVSCRRVASDASKGVCNGYLPYHTLFGLYLILPTMPMPGIVSPTHRSYDLGRLLPLDTVFVV